MKNSEIMKKILLLVCAVALFFSCNESDLVLYEDLNNGKDAVLISQEQEEDILEMANYVKGNLSSKSSSVGTRSMPGTGYRVYMTWWWCSGSGGSCLDDLIVTPKVPNGEVINSLDLFNDTNVGKTLDSSVKSGELNLVVEKNEETKTTFLVYSNPSDPAKNMVIPLVSK